MNRDIGIKKLKQQRQNCKPSQGEKIVIEYLRQNKVSFKREYTMPGLFNPDTNYPLFVDFYIPSLRLVIEVDGSQHYKAFGSTTDFNSLQFRDGIKNKYCIEHGIKMLRVTYDQLNPPYSVLAEAIGGILIHRKITSQQKGFKKQKKKNQHKKYTTKPPKKKRFDRVERQKIKIGKGVAANNKHWYESIEAKRAAARNNYPADIKRRLGIQGI